MYEIQWLKCEKEKKNKKTDIRFCSKKNWRYGAVVLQRDSIFH